MIMAIMEFGIVIFDKLEKKKKGPCLGKVIIMLTRNILVHQIKNGRFFDYEFFWSHKSKNGKIGNHIFSQWYHSPFSENGIRYETAEHFMMASKARLFRDDKSLNKILNTKSPKMAKKIGRGVNGFNFKKWSKHKIEIVLKGSLLKFDQNNDLKDYLHSTKNNVLVEASPFDQQWGIGMRLNHRNSKVPSRWKGQNLLGFCLMEARRMIFK